MLLRREFTVNGNRGSSGLCSALVPMSPVHEIRLQPNNSQQQGPTLKSRIQIWSLGRPIVYQSLPAVRAPHCPSPGHLSAGNNSSAEDTQPLKGTADDMSQYAQRSLLANKSMVQAAWKAPAPIKIWRTRSSLRRSNNALRVDVAQRNQDTRHGFEKRPLPRPIFYKDFWKTIVDDSNEIKDMIEDVVPWHSPLGLHLWDLRDELLCTAQTIDSLLKQCAALYLPREAVDAFRWKDKDDNVSIVKGACGAGLVHSTTSLDDQHFRIVRREFRQSRHLISHYTRVIDRFYRRRGMRGMMDGIFKRIDPLYTTIDPPGRGAENGTDGDQPASNVRLRRMLTASNELKRTLYALQQFFEDLRHYRELLPANARDLTRGGTDEFRVLLGEFDKIVWRQAKSGYSHKPTEPSESSWAGESTQKPSPEFHGTVTQLQSSSETSTRSGENNEGMALLPSQDTENLGVVSSSKRRRTDMSPLFLDERSRRTRFPDFRGPVVHSSSFKETTNQPKGDSGDTAPVKEVPQDSSPVYLSVEGKEGNDFHAGPVKHLLQTSWPKTPLFHSSTPLTSSPNIRSASKPRVAAFHTSAAARRPPATAFAPRETEESDEVSRSNEASEHQCGSPLGYRIPSATMRESMLASRTSRSAYWQYTFYEGPKGEKVKVHYCKSLETTERISKLFLNESVIGFDIEWKPQAMAKDGIRKNVAMIQLASEERIALFHVARFSKGDEIDDLVAPSFRHIMESDAITKVGVSVKSDCSRLRKFLGIDSRGLFELSHLYKLVKFATNDVKRINKLLVSLAKQVEEHLMLPLYKDGSVRASDWSEELDYQQIYYAASDSYAGFQLYHILNNKRLSLFPTPPLPAHADLSLPIRLASGQTVAEYEDPVAEEPPPEPSDAPLSSTDQLAEDVMNLHIEDKSTPPEQPPKPKQPPGSLSNHPSIIAANEWTAQYRGPTITTSTISSTDLSYPLLPGTPASSPSPSSITTTSSPTPSTSTSSTPPKPRATPALLRAYFLFHHHGLSIPDIASLLRAPPLQHSTVAGYVLEAARLEGLAVEKGRVEECLGHVGEAGRGRYRGLLRRLGG